MSIETRLRSTGNQGGAGGSLASSGGLASTGGLFVVYSTQAALPFSKVLSGGNNVTISTNATSIIIAAVTGGAGTGTVNAGSAGFIAYYPSDGTAVSPSTISTSTGSGVASVNFQALTTQIAAAVTGDFWVLNSAGLFLQYFISGTAFYSRLTHTDGSVSSTSAGLAGTGPFYLTHTSGNGTLPNSKRISAGSSITTHTDSTTFYINAITSPGVASSTPGTYNLLPQSAKLFGNNSAARIDAGTPFFRILYSATTLQYGQWGLVVPADYSSNPYIRLLYGADSTIASARSIQWVVNQWGIAANQGFAGGYYADTFGGPNTVNIALSAGYSAGTIQMLTIPLATAVSFGASRLINLRISASGPTMGNAEIIGATLEYTKV